MTNYNTIAENPNSTVVAEYVPIDLGAQKYQSENELEVEFIRILPDFRTFYHSTSLHTLNFLVAVLKFVCCA